ncbi:hypothetical protein GCM10009756_28160 [Pseudokineococcus marinus]
MLRTPATISARTLSTLPIEPRAGPGPVTQGRAGAGAGAGAGGGARTPALARRAVLTTRGGQGAGLTCSPRPHHHPRTAQPSPARATAGSRRGASPCCGTIVPARDRGSSDGRGGGMSKRARKRRSRKKSSANHGNRPNS